VVDTPQADEDIEQLGCEAIFDSSDDSESVDVTGYPSIDLSVKVRALKDRKRWPTRPTGNEMTAKRAQREAKEEENISPSVITRVGSGLVLKSRVNLMLGMIYGDMIGNTAHIASRKGYTSQMLRDTARCIATESICGKRVYTLDNRRGDSNLPGRHICLDIRSIVADHYDFELLKGKVHQICLDYFWFQGVYWADKGFGAAVYQKSIPNLHQILAPGGCIYIPLCVPIFLGLAQYKKQVEKQYTVALVLHADVELIDLVRGSNSIDNHWYASTALGCKDSQPEKLLGLTTIGITQSISCCSNVNPECVIQYLRELVMKNHEPEEYAFIELTKKELLY
jgi:hypothetical protein